MVHALKPSIDRVDRYRSISIDRSVRFSRCGGSGRVGSMRTGTIRLRNRAAHARVGDGTRHARARGGSRDGGGEGDDRWIPPRHGVREVRGGRERGAVVSGIRAKGWRRGRGGARAIDRGRGGERVGETEGGVGGYAIGRCAEGWSRARRRRRRRVVRFGECVSVSVCTVVQQLLHCIRVLTGCLRLVCPTRDAYGSIPCVSGRTRARRRRRGTRRILT